ncbi:hypothetical protein V6Z11_A05G237700 [Gossypium hirsutum]
MFLCITKFYISAQTLGISVPERDQNCGGC